MACNVKEFQRVKFHNCNFPETCRVQFVMILAKNETSQKFWRVFTPSSKSWLKSPV